ncbi:methyltransferase domain protein [bacterium BMS3Abin10]|nr:methyltransferase domain protein [bacterium BMS3Abin10]GBE37514.1 methyltransferase domain protein [bacterium BMS3Bbin08]
MAKTDKSHGDIKFYQQKVIRPEIDLRCPSCSTALNELKVKYESSEINCPNCDYKIIFDGQAWDARLQRDYPTDFSRQWDLWEKGKLGETHLMYGQTLKERFRSLLELLGLSENELNKMKILEIGFGDGRLLQEIQKHSAMAYGIDLVKPLKSSCLRPGSVICGDLFNIPFMPKQFDIVICKGVIACTIDTRNAFYRISEQVATNGMLYLNVYEKNCKKSLILRKIFPGSWRYPESIRLIIANVIGVIRATVKILSKRKSDFELFKIEWGNYKLSTYDVISARWTCIHTKEEIIGWFEEKGFKVRRIGMCNYVGIKR